MAYQHYLILQAHIFEGFRSAGRAARRYIQAFEVRVRRQDVLGLRVSFLCLVVVFDFRYQLELVVRVEDASCAQAPFFMAEDREVAGDDGIFAFAAHQFFELLAAFFAAVRAALAVISLAFRVIARFRIECVHQDPGFNAFVRDWLQGFGNTEEANRVVTGGDVVLDDARPFLRVEILYGLAVNRAVPVGKRFLGPVLTYENSRAEGVVLNHDRRDLDRFFRSLVYRQGQRRFAGRYLEIRRGREIAGRFSIRRRFRGCFARRFRGCPGRSFRARFRGRRRAANQHRYTENHCNEGY